MRSSLFLVLLSACTEIPAKPSGISTQGGDESGEMEDTANGSFDTGSPGGADGGSDGGDGTSDEGSGDGADGGSDGGAADGGGTDGGGSTDGGDGADGGGGEEPCPSGMTCVNRFPYTTSDDTSLSSSDSFDAYSCAPSTRESGPELIYRVDLAEAGFLTVDLPEGDMESGADLDVHILGSLDPDDCIDRGHWRSGAYLPAGSWYVVVDTWVSSGGTAYPGSFSLRLGFTGLSTFTDYGISNSLAERSLSAFDIAWQNGDTEAFTYAITDFELPSTEPRQWIVDLGDGSLLWNLHVTHGEATASSVNPALARWFSNINDSHQSSLGMMRAAEIYTGSYGRSMRLDGLEPGYNDNVRMRAIVVHGWEWARPEVADDYGALGLSWGCPAIDDREIEDVISTMSEGSLYFFSYDDGDWSVNSDYLP